MKIGTKYVLINKNIERVKYDFIKLFYIRGDDENKIFYGKINENNFIYYNRNSRMNTPKLHGELIKNNSETLIKINIFISSFVIIMNLLLFISAVYITIKMIPLWSEKSKYYIIFSLGIIFIVSIGKLIYYFKKSEIMIEDFYLYNEGFYDKYL